MKPFDFLCYIVHERSEHSGSDLSQFHISLSLSLFLSLSPPHTLNNFAVFKNARIFLSSYSYSIICAAAAAAHTHTKHTKQREREKKNCEYASSFGIFLRS